MVAPLPRLFFDYVDPCSWVAELRLREAENATGVEAARHPFELVPPPHPLLRTDDPTWQARRGRAEESGGPKLRIAEPAVVPWSRKAHELALHAREQGVGREVHDALFRAVHLDGRDIGRVDVLLGIARAAGLDGTETKAVLDVDRHAESVRKLRDAAERMGVRGVPTLLAEGRVREGIPAVATLQAILASHATD